MTPDSPHPGKPRVLVDARMAEWTGVGRYTKGLVRALARRDDIQLSAVVAADAPALLEPDAHVTLLPAKRHPFGLAGAREFGRICAEHGHDLLHCLHFPTPSPKPTVPLVVTLHDVTPLIIRGVMPSAGRRYIYRKLNERAVRLADALIADSSSAADDIAEELPGAAEKMRVIPLAADDFAAGPSHAMPAGLLPKGARYIFSMGSTRPHKDLPTLLAAWSLMAERYPDVYLLLAGAGDQLYLDAWLSGEAHMRARFTGRVTDEQLRELYAHADVFAFPSRYEGFGLPPLEAMSLGAPVVAVNAASIPEVVGDAALLVPAGDSELMARDIGQLLDDRSLADGMRARGREHAASFTWELTADRTAGVYRELLAR